MKKKISYRSRNSSAQKEKRSRKNHVIEINSEEQYKGIRSTKKIRER